MLLSGAESGTCSFWNRVRFHRGKGNKAMWSLPPSDSVLHFLSLVAVAAQGMTAALAAGRRSMDWLGVCFLGFAIGSARAVTSRDQPP